MPRSSPGAIRTAPCIPHQWVVKRCKNPNKGRCAICSNSLGFLSPYDKCRTCRISVHSECKARASENCGLTSKHFKEFVTKMFISARQDKWSSEPGMGTSKSMNDMPMMHIIDLHPTAVVDSSSSTNSSAPSTPACFIPGGSTNHLPNVNVIPPPPERFPPHTANICTTQGDGQFTFPEISSNSIPHIILPSSSTDDYHAAIIESQGSDCTLKLGISEDGSDKTESFSESHLNENNHFWDQNGYASSNEGGSGGGVQKRDRRTWNLFTIRAHAWKDVIISFQDIKVNSLIGRGRFGEVYEVDHFGTVAIKLLNMNHVDEEKRLESFKQDTACFQNARHENLVFFCGYTMDRDRLGIVMEFIKGQPLFHILHGDDNNDKRLDFNDIIDFAKQICQGMSYLHTKRILHKDLRSKNIFIKESIKERKVVITDYGIFNVKRLAYPKRSHSFLVPNHWLCYLAPELVKSLTTNLDLLPFSERSDVYAFGTVWFELLTRSFPFSCLPPDSIVWQIGSGMKSPLVNLNSCREAKVLLMQCWAFNASERISFAEGLNLLQSMPKKPLRRSPSFPACKSFESIF